MFCSRRGPIGRTTFSALSRAFNGTLGVWYYAALGRWVIFNEDTSPMDNAEAFNYYYGPSVGSATASGSFALPLNGAGFGDTAAVPLAIHDWVSAYNTSALGVDYGSPTNSPPWSANS